MSVKVDRRIYILDPSLQREMILKMLSDAEPDGMEVGEFRRMAEEKGINPADLDAALAPLLTYANIYLNTRKGRYYYMWSSSLQYE